MTSNLQPTKTNIRISSHLSEEHSLISSLATIVIIIMNKIMIIIGKMTMNVI